jgi:hypothetical protein
MVGGKALGTKNLLHPVLAVWLPNMIFACIGIFFLYRATYGTISIDLKFIDWIKQKLRRKKKSDKDNR